MLTLFVQLPENCKSGCSVFLGMLTVDVNPTATHVLPVSFIWNINSLNNKWSYPSQTSTPENKQKLMVTTHMTISGWKAVYEASYTTNVKTFGFLILDRKLYEKEILFVGYRDFAITYSSVSHRTAFLPKCHTNDGIEDV